MPQTFYVYLIVSDRRAYIGATTSVIRRLRQHNGEISGGAARTRGKGPWRFCCTITGFRTWREALQFEWAFKYHSRRCRCTDSRLEALHRLTSRPRWTSNSPAACDVPIHISLYGEGGDVTLTYAVRAETTHDESEDPGDSGEPGDPGEPGEPGEPGDSGEPGEHQSVDMQSVEPHNSRKQRKGQRDGTIRQQSRRWKKSLRGVKY